MKKGITSKNVHYVERFVRMLWVSSIRNPLSMTLIIHMVENFLPYLFHTKNLQEKDVNVWK